MAKYDVFPNPDGPGYWLDIQTDLLDGLNTRIVAPLMPMDHAPKPAKRLNPDFEIEGARVIMLTQFLSAVPLSLLKKPVANLSEHSSVITDAIDMVMQGF